MRWHKKSTYVEGIVTSDAVHGGRRLPKWFLYSISAVLVVAIIAGGLLVYHYHNSGVNKPTNAVANSVHLTNSQRFQEAVTSAQTQVDSAKTLSQKASAYYNLGAAYLNNNQTTKAIAAYQNSNSSVSSNNPNAIGISTGLGYAYYEAGQTSAAITAFQQTVSLLKQSNDPYSRGKIPEYQNIVQRLQRGEPI
jgi:tetratricopeptide (TPR) repeat protein